MRLIDADALIHDLNIRKVLYRRDVEKCIEDAPTIAACEDCDLAELAEAFAHDYVTVAVNKAIELMTWRPADINTPEEIGAEHVLVTIRWAEDDLEVCEMDPMVMKEYNVIAWQPLPKPYKGDAK